MARPQIFSDQEILKKARACFLEHGAQISAQYIADEVGISQPALFKRFGTKQNLLFQALKPEINLQLIEDLKKGPKSTNVREELIEFAMRIVAHLETTLPAMLLLSSAGQDCICSFKELRENGELPPPTVAHNTMKKWFEMAQKENLIRNESAEMMARIFLGTLQNIVMMGYLEIRTSSKKSRNIEIKSLVVLLLQGIGV